MEKTAISLKLPTDLIEKMDERARLQFKDRTEYIKDLIIADLQQEFLPL